MNRGLEEFRTEYDDDEAGEIAKGIEDALKRFEAAMTDPPDEDDST